MVPDIIHQLPHQFNFDSFGRTFSKAWQATAVLPSESVIEMHGIY